MVTRKPVAGQTVPGQPPYPTSPTTTNPTAIIPKVEPPQLLKAHVESDDEDDDWDKEDSDSEWELEDGNTKTTGKTSGTMALPAPLRISRPASRQSEKPSELPESLRVGPPGGAPAKSKESLVSDMSNTSGNNNLWKSDPSRSPPKAQQQPSYLRPQTTGEALFGPESGSSHWSGTPPFPASHPRATPPMELPTGEFSTLTLGDKLVSSPCSSQPPLIPVEPSSPFSSQPPLIPVATENGKEARHPDRENSVASTTWDPQTDLSSLDAFSSRAHGLPDNALIGSHRTWQEQQAFAKSERERREREAGFAFERAQKAEEERRAEEEWHAGEQAAAAGFPQASPGSAQSVSPEGVPPAKPPRPFVDTSVAQNVQRTVDSPGTVMKKQRNQTYQIKKVRWFDASVGKVRVTPVLVQNANGPCPLLALVNALTLSTPMDIETGLVEILRTREQVSLGLLLDAVFEELMSGRRGEGAHDLPDVSDLYSFLVALHTGMNVNPRFTFKPDGSSMTMHPALRTETQPGGFEDTREMKLYSTFSIPLMHGWLPRGDEPVYAAFERSAKTYEETQNIQFYEEELEAKLGSTGLNNEEQHLFEDLATIKQFMTEWPTQLTEHGLNVLQEHIQPGHFAILFRNDHFSTVYKEPRSQQLLILVTDAGYSSHEEIIWESLVDISGRGTVHYSGDFRPVSHSLPSESGPAGPRDSSLSTQPVQSMLDVDQGWTTVQGKGKARGNQGALPSQQSGVLGSSSSAARNDGPLRADERTKAEQEDHDLALALQLQDEEEERHRAEQATRRREQDLRGQVMDPQQRPLPIAPQQPSRPAIPPRRNNVPATNRPTNPDEESPPTYEQASKDRRFVPPRDHPASPHAPMSSAFHQRQGSAYMQNSATLPPGRHQPGPSVDRILVGSGLGRGLRRQSGINQEGTGQAAEKCTIM